VTNLTLAPLNAEDSARLVASLACGVASGGAVAEQAVASLSAQLFTRTSGHPFFLLETLKVLWEQHAWPIHDGRTLWGGTAPADVQAFRNNLPPSVYARIRALLSPLSPAALSLLLATAVLGQQTTFERQRAVAHLAEEEALAALDEVLARSLLRETGGTTSAPMYTFSYEPMRETVYSQASDARRRLFQRRAMAVLERAGLRIGGRRSSVASSNEAPRLCAVCEAPAHTQSA
jgi:predicted ATPase